MTRLGDFIGKQGLFLLENDRYAYIYIAILALLPLGGWLSAAIIALITLRKGWEEGFKGLIVAVAMLLALSLMTRPLSAALVTVVIRFLPCYLTALVLYMTASWRMAGVVIVLQALLAIALVHWLAPEFIADQYQGFLALLRSSSDSASASLLSNQSVHNELVVANYLVGVESVSLVASAIASLLLARSVQSRLFYPGGFRQEMLAFRASGFGVILLVLTVLGAYQHNALAMSSLPILVGYYVSAGLSLSFSILAKDRGVGILLLLIIPMALLPFVILPVYTIFGALDSLFNFRLRLPSSAGEKENKG